MYKVVDGYGITHHTSRSREECERYIRNVNSLFAPGGFHILTPAKRKGSR